MSHPLKRFGVFALIVGTASCSSNPTAPTTASAPVAAEGSASAGAVTIERNSTSNQRGTTDLRGPHQRPDPGRSPGRGSRYLGGDPASGHGQGATGRRLGQWKRGFHRLRFLPPDEPVLRGGALHGD